MKKKLFCLLLAMIMVLSLGACGGDNESAEGTGEGSKSDFDSFMELQKNMENIKDMSFKYSMDMSSPDNEDLTMKMSGTAKEVIKGEDDIQMEMKYSTTIPEMGSDLEGTLYMKDKTIYMDIMGQKVKLDASNEVADMANMANMDPGQMLAITEDMVSDLKMSKDGSDTVYAFNLDGNKAVDYFMKTAGSAQGQTEATDDMTFDKIEVTVTAGEDGMVKNIDMDCGLTTKVEDTSVKMNYKVVMEYESINTDLKIKFPDFSEYQEMSV